MLNPADDYVANFVRHVDRGKVVQVASVMEPAAVDTAGPTVTMDTALTDALRDMMGHGVQCLRVCDEAGRTVGRLSLQRAIAVSAGV